MRRGLVHLLAWLLATGAAVTLSWWGVHTVMAGTAYDPPRALPIKAADAATPESQASATPSERTPPPKRRKPSPPPTAGKQSPAPTKPAGPSPTPAGSGRVESYDTDGGRAVFDLGRTSASLVSATPGAGWSMQVWKTEAWIRVEFSSGADRVSVFCTWHDGPPRVEIGNY
ncbi:hypothetical protein [Streptomyces lomondensis]|uniref:Secreted protein n=1 Tax=Streptomyces lomondensis TaxID=68229 RepID=A0ABQ2WU46_9ACTN|nr:hypothetical protein [Streptomyces lomondensis]MCF0078572.1 hypothetical protein [Streptomyces lomondensis]GGW78463.1 hypothetical protein GCM10010383_02320 [Streptomyces lomondensis]